MNWTNWNSQWVRRHPGVRAALGLVLLLGTGCARHTPAIPGGDDPLPLTLTRQQQEETLVVSLEKLIAGRMTSHTAVQRVVHDIAPIIEEAAAQPEAVKILKQIAAERGQTFEEVRQEWLRLHEANIVVESGGDANAISYAGAAGVSQWMPGTARANGLRVDLAESNRLTARIRELPAPEPGRPQPTFERALEDYTALEKDPIIPVPLESLMVVFVEKRRRVDERFDPRKAIFAQTRYLLGRYPRFPSFDWLLQAYHGGEAGARRLIQKHMGSSYLGSPAEAIRQGLSFSDVYFTATPVHKPDSFGYLYGRGDNHRYYWWKVLAAREVIALYRKSPDDFEERWKALLPGRATEDVWYPNALNAQIIDWESFDRLITTGSAVRVQSGTAHVLTAAPAEGAWLRPEARGTLLIIASSYHRFGGSGQLKIGDTFLPLNSLPLVIAEKSAAELPGGGPPPDVDMHPTGLAFDIQRPTSSRNRKILEYVLGMLSDRQVIYWRSEQDARYHIVPNSRFQKTLQQIKSESDVPAFDPF